MLRTEPTTKIDEIGIIKPQPHKNVAEYYLSKQCKSRFFKPPNWDSPGDSIELLFLQNQNEHKVILHNQAELLERSERDAKLNIEREDAIYKTQEGLRGRFMGVTHFIKDCDDKRRKAQELIDEESKTHERLAGSIKFLKTEAGQMDSFRKEFLNTLATYEPYERLTQEVVQESAIFDSALDCISRCDALMLAQEEIKVLTIEKIKEIEAMRLQIIFATQKAKLKVLGMQNDLLSLNRSFEEAQAKCKKYEKLLADTNQTISMLELDRQQSCNGLFGISCLLNKRKDIPEKFSITSVLEMSDFIVREVQFLNQLVNKLETDATSKKKGRVQSVCQ